MTTRQIRALGRPQCGFSLIEVIVAMVLLSTTGMALMVWINQSLETGARLQMRLDEAELIRLSSATLATLDLARQEQGEEERLGMQLNWRAQAIAPPVFNEGFALEGHGPWKLTLYRVAVEVTVPGQPVAVKYSTLMLSKSRT